jgi:hypothetical protein
MSSGRSGHKAWFNGWSRPCVLLNTTLANPWVGVVRPTSDVVAEIDRIALSTLTWADLLEIIQLLDSKSGADESGFYEGTWNHILAAAGCIE